MTTAASANLNHRSNVVRQARADVRRQLGSGGLTIAAAMHDRPSDLGDIALFEIVLMARNVGRRRLRQLNERAVAAGVNLALTLQEADERTRDWVAANALHSSPLSVWARVMED